MLTRREFLLSSALLPALPRPAAARYDLLVKGGRVIDPSQKLDRMVDVAVKDGKISAVRANIPASDAAEVIDASNRLVTPGLVDIHLHARPGELSAQRILSGGVTTCVDGGSRGNENIGDMVEVARNAPNRVRALMNIGRRGNNPEGELLDLANIDAEASRQAIRDNREIIVGIKVRLAEQFAAGNAINALRLAQQVAKPYDRPLMIHIGNTRPTVPDILSVLKPGDIITHVYSPPPNNIFDDDGRVLKEVREARKRGILFDIGHGLNGHFVWELAERSFQQDFFPDTITSDLNGAGLVAQVFDFPNILSKFLLLGMSLEQTLARATINAANAIPALKGLGTLKTGAAADITILELATGSFEFVDNVGGKRAGRQKLFARAVVVGGKPWKGEMSPAPPAEPRA